MRVYNTFQVHIVGSYNVTVSGPTIYAHDKVHAKICLRHIGKGDLKLGLWHPAEKIDPNCIVELDSLIAPNKLQLN